ncbi:hypothetical protein DPMN_060718 [Dreissena polymorpha]|uniref:Uncharacterized protein n=1 Tax=Dreissena polymorpha TaxID=45954 RepID=A0A9D4C695_DREPO|nr:hypothetical protein DPMN_060718 [Dreissena polymorpha]
MRSYNVLVSVLKSNNIFVSVLKSDNANGLFYFPQPCQPPSPSTEAATITCTVARQRGDDGQVIVTWSVYQLIGSQVTLATQDFVEYTGQVVFAAGERTKVILLNIAI